MFGLTTISQLRAEIDAHHLTIGKLLTAEDRVIPAYTAVIRERTEQRREVYHWQNRLYRALRGCSRWRKEAAHQRRTTELLAQQLLDATGGHSTAARRELGLPEDGPWQRAVEGLNALVDAQEAFHIEPDGHISNPMGDQHIEWDRKANRFRLVHDDETHLAPVITVDELLAANAKAVSNDG